MAETQCGSRECVIEGQPKPEEEGEEVAIEVRARSREEEILRELGILHLDNKATRPRFSADETDATILKQAGVSYIMDESDKENGAQMKKKKSQKKEKELNDKLNPKPLSRKEADILRAAGVTLLDNMAVVIDDDTYCHKLGCETATTTAGSTLGESTVNSTYAERELTRRLKHGWSSTGDMCEECGMPIIYRKKGSDLLECVICGVVGEGEDEENYDNVDDLADNYNSEFDETYSHGLVSRGVFDVGTNISSITPSIGTEDQKDAVSQYRDDEGQCHSQVVCDANVADDDDDEAYKEELGLRLFEGWELTSLNCPSCNLPLISEGDGAPSICLRCG